MSFRGPWSLPSKNCKQYIMDKLCSFPREELYILRPNLRGSQKCLKEHSIGSLISYWEQVFLPDLMTSRIVETIITGIQWLNYLALNSTEL